MKFFACLPYFRLDDRDLSYRRRSIAVWLLQEQWMRESDVFHEPLGMTLTDRKQISRGWVHFPDSHLTVERAVFSISWMALLVCVNRKETNEKKHRIQ